LRNRPCVPAARAPRGPVLTVRVLTVGVVTATLLIVTVLTATAALAATAAAAVAFAPGGAATRAGGGPTSATFDVNGGTLSITTPAGATLGIVTLGAPSVSGILGTVTVTDNRSLLRGSWASSVSSTAFTTGSGAPGQTVPAADVSYAPGRVAVRSGVGTFTPGPGGVLGTSKTAFTASGETGVTSCSWNPTITVTLPSALIAGTYTGTITHSAA
jgi:hypothetical protein